MALTGEITFPDGSRMLVPQPCRFEELRSGSPLDDFYITLPELPSHQDVLQAANSTAQPTVDPFWARVCAFVGGFALLGVGLFFVALGAWIRFAS